MKIDLIYGMLIGLIIIFIISGIKIYEIGQFNGKYELCKNMNKNYYEKLDTCITCEELGGEKDLFGNCITSGNYDQHIMRGIQYKNGTIL